MTRPDGSTPDDPNTWTHGLCGVLAYTLHARTGWQVVGIFDRLIDHAPRHVGLLNPTGGYADGRGLSVSEEEFISPYRVGRCKNFEGYGPWIKPMTKQELGRFIKSRSMSQFERCSRKADELLGE